MGSQRKPKACEARASPIDPRGGLHSPTILCRVSAAEPRVRDTDLLGALSTRVPVGDNVVETK
ncbi:hypothetical protein MLIT_11110 [Mycolicibacterium litorale]|uniref:Uncharacterized protein n=1 Tax=Mycolicibacterium litorale TaxID=758802 RepID=A0AAD1IHE9_9MYCO|nr:hypothetical protein MLIT_11110 [Mycolicibacterium litorale]